jgi:hypothetical protein
MPAPAPKKSGAGTGAAVMYILGAVLLFITLAFGAIVATAGSIMGSAIKDYQSFAAYLWGVCVIMPLVGAIFGILGTVFIFQRKKFGIAMIGGILGIVAGILSGILVYAGNVGYNPIGLMAFIFFMIGVLLLFMVKKEFQ